VRSLEKNAKSNREMRKRKKAGEPMLRRRWTKEEHTAFCDGMHKNPRQWQIIAELVKTRTPEECRKHAPRVWEGGGHGKNEVDTRALADVTAHGVYCPEHRRLQSKKFLTKQRQRQHKRPSGSALSAPRPKRLCANPRAVSGMFMAHESYAAVEALMAPAAASQKDYGFPEGDEQAVTTSSSLSVIDPVAFYTTQQTSFEGLVSRVAHNCNWWDL
jgi:hypothetical protein